MQQAQTPLSDEHKQTARKRHREEDIDEEAEAAAVRNPFIETREYGLIYS